MPAETVCPGAHSIDDDAVKLRTASLVDAPRIWELVAESGVLDPNSLYCYMLLCRDFSDTSIVAYRDGRLIGFVTAYRPPNRSDVLFVWQIGVASAARRMGLGRRMLHALLEAPAARDVRYLEATVTPSNTASRRLFESFALSMGAACSIGEGFASELFGDGRHETEELFRIGPLRGSVQREMT